jgi:hypothetical protein
MESLLTKVIDAHGGLKRWNELNKVQVTIIAGGKLLEIQGSKYSKKYRFYGRPEYSCKTAILI